MNFMEFFSPVPGFLLPDRPNGDRLGDSIRYFGNVGAFPDLSNRPDLLLLGLGERKDGTVDNRYPDEIRKHLYTLYKGLYKPDLADAGNIRFEGLGEAGTEDDRIVEALSWAMNSAGLVILLGHSQDYTWHIHEAYRRRNMYFNLCVIDASLDMGDEAEELDASNWLGKILFNRLNKLFNVSLMGYQNYLVPPRLVQTFRDLHFDVVRLGDLRAQMEEAEPYLRDADVVSIDASSMQYSSCPAAREQWPNGLRGEELCRMARYLGMSPKLTCAGVFNLDTDSPQFSLGASAMAQVVWHIIDGFYARTVDNPDFSSSEYLSYEVAGDTESSSLRFYQNRISGRWWLRIPLPIDLQIQYNVPEFVVPCSEKDYLAATMNEVPERWMNSLKKLNL
ncbi:MAG: arginase family protein [Bacteroidia bacterium]|nr:arginase family protein [Bacteroidia bacterium]